MAIRLGEMPRMSPYIVTDQTVTNSLSLPSRHALKEAFISTFDPTRIAQRLRISDARSFGRLIPRPSEIAKKQTMEISHRISNGLRLGLLDTPSGRIHHEAREDARTKDHGFEHDRRHFKWVRALVEHSPNIRFAHEDIPLAMALFSPFHDANQLDISYANLSLPKSEKFRPKDAHDFAGALQTLAYRTRYAKEAHITSEKARSITGLGAAMMLFHDEPSLLAKMQEQTALLDGRKAYAQNLRGQRIMLHGQALIQAVEEGCDVLSLSPRQISELTRYYKAKADPRYLTDAPHGLLPQFERDFADELALVDSDDQPLCENPSLAMRQEYLMANKIEVLADQLDMIVPFGEGLIRMFPLEVSRNRPLFEPNIQDRVLKIEGNPTIDSDLGRKLWEIRTLADRIADPILMQSPSIRKIIAEVQVKSLLEIKRIGAIIMQGDETATRSLMEQIQYAQLPAFADKMLDKAHVPHRRFTGGNSKEYAIVIAENMQLSSNPQVQKMGERLHAKIQELQNGVDLVMEGLTDERKTGTNGLTTYSPEDIRQFEDLCDEIIFGFDKLRKRGIKSMTEIHGRKRVHRIMQQTALDPSVATPFTTHASTQTFASANIRTWSEASQKLLTTTRRMHA